MNNVKLGFSNKLDAQLDEAIQDLKITLLMIQNQSTLKGKLRDVTKETIAFNRLRAKIILESLIKYIDDLEPKTLRSKCS